ncbi:MULTISPECIES: hypothetical protein [Acidianus]|jgi:hypothetical protein|uniref:Uncharacterized protein n=1 Tax=Acidianus ambivalens TaxID=2283 RepID=A0A650CV98_ACIAM|nr:hypothetical protein [Acidianus ambivalens]MCY0874484.1 hypothetical protein [Acidianus infernus]MQL55617.1 hypothetical protein [Acidianus ambivalens]QGR21801.1 hypothetical protein D1866_07140 [Acidianus ambivalens]
MKRDNYTKDLHNIKCRIISNYGNLPQIDEIYKRLIDFHKLGFVNITHSALELIVAAYLIKEGFKVSVEHESNGKIIDVYAIKGIDVGIEVETGFVPPSFAGKQEDFLMSRMALKIARYSNLASQFYIAVPSYYIPPVPVELLKDKEKRSEDEIRNLMRLIRKYHNSLDVNLLSLKSAKIDGIIIINTTDLKLKIFDYEDFLKIKKYYSDI